ncbi:MAG TPA: dihydrolipoyllysine-residue succinyltransferase, partial [Tahibacter sp.]|nr:dihydrolipoyllysine-residue succinyltransferase [Tahibacter sp.]
SGKTGGVAGGARPEERVPMTRIRARIAERLMQSKNSIAMLTSFNEVNLAEVVKLRKALGEQFEKANGVKLGFMSFFVKAATEALKRYPVINASVDGSDIIYHGYQDISIAVSTDKGLVTPVLRNVERMGFAEIESAIAGYAKAAPGARPEERVAMTRMRSKIAERLMQSKNSIAMLTSFNEINLAKVSAMRKELGEQFEKTNGIKLGFMSFFVKAAAEALKRHPIINASVDGNDVVYHGYQDISVAVSTDKGLVTPVLRDAQNMGFADVEKAIANYAKKAREGGLTLDDLAGGTFTITNGGTFGSLFSTPIVNPPQSAILGMHAIKDRAIVENGQVIAAPMMYVAISYDHRIIDGKDAVLFLVDIKNQLENPHKMLLGL